MSKAFTKEGDGEDLEPDLEHREDAEDDDSVPKGTKNYITPKGAETLRSELHELLHVERPALVKTVQWAASNGDRSENADYIYGKRRLREIDKRIRFLTKRLDNAEIVDPTSQKSDRVVFGATVTIEDEQGNERRYSIVGVDEIDAKQGKISWLSPIGRALLKAQVGDSVTVRMPKGDEDFEIRKIEYIAI